MRREHRQEEVRVTVLPERLNPVWVAQVGEPELRLEKVAVQGRRATLLNPDLSTSARVD
jgi:hypothetical protein